MLDKVKLAAVVEKYLAGSDRFLVGVAVSKTNVVDVFVDGDEGISISECVAISRHIESVFDRDLEDYELRVSSPGLTKPFKLRRQYNKYLNKEIKVKKNTGEKYRGKLISLDDDSVSLEVVTGKREKTSGIETIFFADIAEAKPVISFK